MGCYSTACPCLPLSGLVPCPPLSGPVGFRLRRMLSGRAAPPHCGVRIPAHAPEVGARMSRPRSSRLWLALLAILPSMLGIPVAGERAPAEALPSGFREYIVFSGLTAPTAVEFAPDGRVF